MGDAMKAIIVGAGRGIRMMPATESRPKCLLPVVNGRSILETTIETLRKAGVHDVVFVGGYAIESVRRAFPSLTFARNPDWATTNILASLMCAGSHLSGPAVVTYSDITFSVETVERLLTESADVALAIDPNWRASYEGRTLHPESEAEKVTIRDGHVAQIGKRVPIGSADGEFIGLATFSESAVETMHSRYRALRLKHEDHPFHEAARLRDAYLTDMIQDLIVAGTEVHTIPVVGAWAEFDTLEDVMRATGQVSGSFAGIDDEVATPNADGG